MIQYFFIFCLSIIVSLAFIFLFKSIFYKYKILDNPKKYNLKRSPIPYSMGIIFFLSFFIISYSFIEYNYKLGLIWIFGFLISTISFIDDMLELNAKIRLLFQILIGAIIGITSIKIGYISNIFGGILNLETYNFIIFDHIIYIIPFIFTIIWYVFIFNSLNWTDGIQGNTSGLSFISFLILFFLGLILFYKDDYEGGIENAKFIMKISIILVGIILPFWWLDFKEKILMGDSGTMFLGFMLATLAIIAGGKIATVLVVFGIYSVDAIYVIVRRLINKKSPLKGDFSHLHHRLLKLGLSKNQVLSFIYLVSFFFGLTALFLDKTGKIIVFGIIIIVVVFIHKIVEIFQTSPQASLKTSPQPSPLEEREKEKKIFSTPSKERGLRGEGGFTLIELMVVISIIMILSTSGVLYFFDFIGDQKIKQELYKLNEEFKELDNKVKNYSIFDYTLILNTLSGGLAYVYYTNIFDSNKIQKIDFDSSSGFWTLQIDGGSPYLWDFNIYKNIKLFINEIISGNISYTGSFLEEDNYKISGTLSGIVINDIGIKYFSKSNIDKEKKDFLELININTLPNKTGSGYTELKIINIGNKKEIIGNGTDKIDKVYLFFEKEGKEKTLLIQK